MLSKYEMPRPRCSPASASNRTLSASPATAAVIAVASMVVRSRSVVGSPSAMARSAARAKRHGRRHRLQAPAPAATARGTVGHDRTVPDLAGEPALPEEEPPVGHDAGADPHVDVDADVRPHAARGADASLSDRDRVDDVVDDDRQPSSSVSAARSGKSRQPRFGASTHTPDS